MQKIRKILTAVSEKTTLPTNQISVSYIGLIWTCFQEYLQIKNFKKIQLCHFFVFIVPQLNAKKSEQSLELLMRKLPYQPTNYSQQH